MKFLLSLVFVFTCYLVQAQQSQDYLKYKDDYSWSAGYIIDGVGKRFDGLIKRNEGGALYGKVTFVSKNTNSQTFRPDEILGYGIPPRRFVSNNSYFLEVMQEGKLGLYRRIYWTKQIGAPHYGSVGITSFRVLVNGVDSHGNTDYDATETIVYFLRKKDVDSFSKISKKRGFRNSKLQFISDCPKLISDIKSKIIPRKDIEEIVYQYNRCN